MGIMQVNQIKSRLHREYDGLINLEDVKGSNKENYFLTRSLAAYAIQCLVEENKDDIVRSITDGSKDNGIDAVYFDNDYEELYLVQSKWNHKGDSEPDLGEIKKFIDGIEDLVSLKFDKFNEKINKRKEEIKNHLLNPKIKLKIVLAYTAVNLSSDAKTCFDELLQRQNDSNEGTFLEIMNQSRLHNSLIASSTSEPIKMEGIHLTEWGRRDEPKKAFYGQVDGLQIATWWDEYGNRLFTKNIRKLLGDSSINNEIRRTIDVDPENFWYYNNGITMICDDIKKRKVNGENRDYGVFDCENAFIVNGAQTVGTIGKYSLMEEDDDTLSKVKIFVRIISLKDISEDSYDVDQKFAENVTKNNNRQNKIQNRDFVSLDEQQRRIASELAVEGIYYHIMRSDEVLEDDENFDLEESTVALSCARDIDAATLAHREPGKIWSDINHSRYKKLFNPSTTSYYVWNTVQIFRQIDNAIIEVREEEENEREAILTYGRELIACSIFHYIGTENISKNEIMSTLPLDIKDLLNLIKERLSFITNIIDDYGGNFANIFKNFGQSKEIFVKLQEAEKSVEPREISNEVSIDSLIETKLQGNNKIKARLYNFDNKISGNKVAEKAFSYWIENMFDPEVHEIGIISNIHHYKIGESDRDQRFLFRIRFGKELTLEFNHSSYGREYTSLLFEHEDFQAWLDDNTENDKVVFTSANDIELLKGIESFL